MDNKSVGTIIISGILIYLSFLGGKAYQDIQYEKKIKKHIEMVKLISESHDRLMNKGRELKCWSYPSQNLNH